MADVEIMYINKSDDCKEIMTNFLILFKKSNYIEKMPNNDDDGSIVLSKPSVLVFFNRPSLAQEVEATLGNLISNGNFLMIIIVSPGTADQQTSIPAFTMDSKVCMWASVCGCNENKCTKTEENVRANNILDCFLSNIHNPKHAMMEVDEERSNQLQMTKNVEAQAPIDIATKKENMSVDSRDDYVRVICCGISKHYYEPFAKFIRTKMRLTTRLVDESKNSNRTPLVALCVQYDDTQKDIKALEKVIAGSQATLVIIIECAKNVPPPTTQLSFNETVFPNLVRLLYSISDHELYDCKEARYTVELLKIIWSDNSILGSESSGKSKEKGTIPKNSNKPRMSIPANSSQGLMRVDSRDIAILCSRKIEVCKKIFMNIKSQCSIQRDIPWISKVEEANKATKIILFCLKISRLTDDIADATKMACLSVGQKYFLVIIHTTEPGVDPDISVPMRDERILDVANILYSENVGCYDCPENRAAKSKISSWFTQTK